MRFQLALEFRKVPPRQFVICSLCDLGEHPGDLGWQIPSEVALLFDLLLQCLGDDLTKHANKMIFGKFPTELILELDPLLQVRFKVGEIVAPKESDKVPSLEVRQLSRSSDILGMQGPPVLKTIKLFATDQGHASS